MKIKESSLGFVLISPFCKNMKKLCQGIFVVSKISRTLNLKFKIYITLPKYSFIHEK